MAEAAELVLKTPVEVNDPLVPQIIETGEQMLENQDEKINEAVALVTDDGSGQGGDKDVKNVINDPNVIQAADPVDEK